MTAAPSMAEVLAKHATCAMTPGEWWRFSCGIEVIPAESLSQIERDHQAQALSLAGFGHVASVEAEVASLRLDRAEFGDENERLRNHVAWLSDESRSRSLKAVAAVTPCACSAQRARAEAAEAQVAAVRALADEWAAEDSRLKWTTHLTASARAIREALDGEATP